MTLKKKLKKQINEAIASKNTTDSNRLLLIKIRDELSNANDEKKLFSVFIKIIEVIGALAKAWVTGSG